MLSPSDDLGGSTKSVDLGESSVDLGAQVQVSYNAVKVSVVGARVTADKDNTEYIIESTLCTGELSTAFPSSLPQSASHAVLLGG